MRPEESFVGQPIRSLQTMLRIISEYDGSVPSLNPDGIYGSKTTRAVIQFQRNAGLSPTGIVDLNTWNQIVKKHDEAIISIDKAEPIEIIWDPNKIYILGDSHPNLYLAQSMLIYLSKVHNVIKTPNVTGTLDQKTSESISSFQKINDLPETGQLDKRTWKHLSKQFTLNANRNVSTFSSEYY